MMSNLKVNEADSLVIEYIERKAITKEKGRNEIQYRMARESGTGMSTMALLLSEIYTADQMIDKMIQYLVEDAI